MNFTKLNKVQFSVVREDANIEFKIFEKFNIKKPIFIGSGGCTAFNLASVYPNMKITLIELNPAQIKLIQKKIEVLSTSSKTEIRRLFGVSAKEVFPESLIELGNFESLFCELREFIYRFVVSKENLLKLIYLNKKQEWSSVFSHPYWSVAFELFFSDVLLRSMFGNAAIQHAPKGSYPKYFKDVIEKGLERSDSKDNYFLHHIFFGHYFNKKESLPRYLQVPPKKVDLSFINCMAEQVPSYSEFDFVGLSNIFDWSSKKDVKFLAKKLSLELKPGAVVLFRQLNNTSSFNSFFGKKFTWDKKLAQSLHTKDKSLFYRSVHIGVRK